MSEVTSVTNANREFSRWLSSQNLTLSPRVFIAIADYVDDQYIACLVGNPTERADAAGRLHEIEDLIEAHDLEGLDRLNARLEAPGPGLASVLQMGGYLLEEVLSRRAVMTADEWLASSTTSAQSDARAPKITLLGPGRRVFRFTAAGRLIGFVMAHNEELLIAELQRRSNGAHTRPVTRREWQMSVLGLAPDVSTEDRTALLRTLHHLNLDANGCAPALGVLIDAAGMTHSFEAMPDELVVQGDIKFPAGCHPPRSLKCSGDVRLSGIEGITIQDTLRCSDLIMTDCATIMIETTGCTCLTLFGCEDVVMDKRLAVEFMNLHDCTGVTLPDHFTGNMSIYGGAVSNMGVIQGTLSIDRVNVPDGVKVTRNLKTGDVKQIGTGVEVGGSALIDSETDLKIGSDFRVDGNLWVEVAGTVSIGSGARVAGTTSIQGDSAVIGENCTFFDDLEVETYETMPEVSDDIVTLGAVDIGMIAELGSVLDQMLAETADDAPDESLRH